MEKDPKQILANLVEYGRTHNIQCTHRKNAHRLSFKLPLSDGVTLIEFEINFEKEKKKSLKGLYRVSFGIGDTNKDKLQSNDVEFLSTGFVQLIQ